MVSAGGVEEQPFSTGMQTEILQGAGELPVSRRIKGS